MMCSRMSPLSATVFQIFFGMNVLYIYINLCVKGIYPR